MKRFATSLPAIIFAVCAMSCAGEAARPEPLADHVILIAPDGFSSAVVRNTPGAFPNIESLIRDGSHTLERRSVLPSSSAVNWASMLMGAGPELHGYTEWGSQTPELPSREIGAYGLFPGIVGLIRDSYPDAEIGVGYSWPTIGCLYEQQAADVNYNGPTERAVADSMARYIVERKPRFAFACFDQPDGAGHKYGWDSPEYLDSCKMIDVYVGELLGAIDRAGIKENTIVIFTSDHGGINKGHGGKTMDEMESPFVMCGRGVKKGYDITHSVMVYDCAPTIAHIFGLSRPHVWTGRPVTTAFE